MQAEQTRSERIAAIKKSIADLDARKKRLIRTLEVTGDDDEEPDQELIQDIKNRRAEIKAERAKLAAELEQERWHHQDRREREGRGAQRLVPCSHPLCAPGGITKGWEQC
jgi:hypothetical protein